MGIVLAARLLGKLIAHRVTGVDLVERLAERGSRTGLRFFLLGASPGVAERAAGVLAGTTAVSGSLGRSPDPPTLRRRTRDAAWYRPPVPTCCSSYGSPAQDLWIARTSARLNVPVSIGVGGSLDYIAKIVVRAPLWMRKLGLEWLYRLLSQPARWRRMIVLPVFVFLVIGQALLQKRGMRRKPIPVSGSPEGLPS